MMGRWGALLASAIWLDVVGARFPQRSSAEKSKFCTGKFLGTKRVLSTSGACFGRNRSQCELAVVFLVVD